MRNALATCALVIATFTAGFAAPAAAIDRLVDESLVPCASGGLPIHATMSDAVAAAAPGDTIGVCGGTYTESVVVDKDGLVLQALGLVKLLSPPAALFGFAVIANDVTIQGFDVSGFTEIGACGVVAFGVGGDIRSNRVHDNDLGLCLVDALATRVRNNVIENNADDGILAQFIDSVQLSTNTVRNNGGFGIEAYFCDRTPGLPVTDIHHNSLTGNGADGIFVVDCPVFIQNNTVRNNAQAGTEFHGIHVADTVGGVVTKNLVQSSNVGIVIENVADCTVSFNNVSFNSVGIGLFESDGCTLARNNVSRSDVVDCLWDGVGTHTFTANACGTEIPAGAWY